MNTPLVIQILSSAAVVLAALITGYFKLRCKELELAAEDTVVKEREKPSRKKRGGKKPKPTPG